MRELIQMLIEKGRLPAALCEAARWGDREMLETLLARGLDINTPAENGSTPLMLAASGGHVELVRWLLGKGARVNERHPQRGKTALHWCLTGFHFEPDRFRPTKSRPDPEAVHRELISLLLAHGADPLLQDADGSTSLDLARNRKYLSVVQLLTAAIERASPK